VVFEIYSATNAEYRLTGDRDSALAKAALGIIGQELSGSGEQFVTEVVKICWDSVKTTAGYQTSQTEIDELVVNSIMNVLVTKGTGDDVDPPSFLADSCSSAVGMLFEATVRSKEYESKFLGRDYNEQKIIEGLFKDLSGQLANAFIGRLVDENFSSKALPDKMLNQIMKQVLNESINSITSS